MRNSRLSLRASETTLILQSRFEEMTPQQVLVRDRLVKKGVPCTIATEIVIGIGVYTQVMNHMEEYIAKMVSKGHPENTVRDAMQYISKVTDVVLKDYPEIDTVSCPLPEHLDRVIALCASGVNWNNACEKVSASVS